MIYELKHIINGEEFTVRVTKKRIRRIIYRFDGSKFLVSAPFLVAKREIINGLDRFGASLVERNRKRQKPQDDSYIYLFGNKVDIYESGSLSFSDGTSIKYKNREDLNKKLKKWFQKYVESRVRKFQTIMNTPEYKVGIKNMSTRFGSNSKQTKSLYFAFILIHYSCDIIDSVIVHELAHCKVFNHSKEFYDVVYKYCPNYDYYHDKLRKGEFL